MLIVLRGNAASGKTTVASQLQQRLPRPTAVLSQDYFRRSIYDELERESGAHSDLLEAAACHCIGLGQNVVLDGIFNARRYSAMLERISHTAQDARFYAFDLSFEETVRRHETRPKSSEFTSLEMSEWYHGWQPLLFVEERRIDHSESVEEIVGRILADR